MTTTVQIPLAQPRQDRRPAGRLVLFGALALNVAIVAALFVAAGPSHNPLVTVGRLAGLLAALLMAWQLMLIARVRWLDERLGMDKLTAWHRWTGFSLLWTLVAHVVLVVTGYAQDAAKGFVAEVFVLSDTFTGVFLAVIAFALVLVVGATSARIARRRLPYETWHAVHLLTYAVIALAFLHQIVTGSTIAASPISRIYWIALWGTAIGMVIAGRVVRPLRRNLRYQLRVSAVVQESHDVVSVYITGKNLHELRARAGQFFVWRFLAKGLWWQAHPFSLSAAPDGRGLRLTAKALGAGSASLRDLLPGTRVYAEGPYGAFTTANQIQPNALLIAGGVGITPIRALMEEITGHVVVLYRVRDERDAVLLHELQRIAYHRGSTVHLLTGPSAGQFTASNLFQLVPDVASRDTFVCGPAGMTNAVLAGLRELRVPSKQVHAERFSLAS